MTQQQWDTVAPSTPTVYSRPFRVVIMAFLAIFAFGIGNTSYSVRHRSAQLTASTLTQGRLTQVHATQPQLQADPGRPIFDENRDGSGSLGLEDLNGTATVWDDEKAAPGSSATIPASCSPRRTVTIAGSKPLYAEALILAALPQERRTPPC